MKGKLNRSLLLIGVAGALFLATWLGGSLPLGRGSQSPSLLSSGLAVAAVLLLEPWIWPAVLVGLFLGKIVSGPPPGIAGGPWAAASLGIAAGQTLQALAANWLLHRFAGGRQAFDRPRGVFRFLVLGAILSTAIGSLSAAAALGLSGFKNGHGFGSNWLVWWLGETTSVIVILPLVVVWVEKGWPRLNWGRAGELALLLTSLVLSCEIFFNGLWLDQRAAPLAFLIIPLLLWTALRFHQRGATSACLLMAVFAVQGTLSGYGPFVLENPTEALSLAQGFVSVVAMVALMTAADVALRVSTERNLRESEQRYRELFENNPQPAWVYDYETLGFLAVNNSALQHYGYTQEEFLKLSVTDISPAQTGPVSGEMAPNHRRHRKKDGTIIDAEVTRYNLLFDQRPAAMVMSTDISQRIQAEGRTAALSSLARSLSMARTPPDAGQMMADTAEKLFSWDGCVLTLCVPGQAETETVFASRKPARLAPKQDAKASEPPVPTKPEEAGAAAGADLAEPGPSGEPWASVMSVPLRKDERELGTFTLQSHKPNAYSPEDRQSLQALADLCGGALERMRAEGELERLNQDLERRVAQRTSQLEAINRELEAFCYSVSHDLRAPLRSMRGFSEVVLERYGEHLDERGREFLRRACESSQMMDKLIEDLLKLSRVTRAELQRRPVDLSALAQGIATELHAAEPQRSVQFIITPDLTTEGDERLLRVALDNLLRNAWKFTSKRSEARIEFGSAPEPAQTFFVRDNGAGFDMAYANKLFTVFQRLHSTSDFSGTGVGLATVQRIINRHGGRAWATGEVNHGATFYFTLPGDWN